MSEQNGKLDKSVACQISCALGMATANTIQAQNWLVSDDPAVALMVIRDALKHLETAANQIAEHLEETK
jgi:hypothetical protein